MFVFIPQTVALDPSFEPSNLPKPIRQSAHSHLSASMADWWLVGRTGVVLYNGQFLAHDPASQEISA